MKIAGLDISLTSTGVALIDSDRATVQRITSNGSRDATLEDRSDRLTFLARSIAWSVAGADLVVIEQPAYSRNMGSAHDRSGLWWLVAHHLASVEPRPIAEVAPTSRAKYATGKGNASKDAVLAAVVRRYSDVEVTGNDEADALVLAAMGARWLEQPIEEALPQTHLAAMDKVRWPSLDQWAVAT